MSRSASALVSKSLITMGGAVMPLKIAFVNTVLLDTCQCRSVNYLSRRMNGVFVPFPDPGAPANDTCQPLYHPPDACQNLRTHEENHFFGKSHHFAAIFGFEFFPNTVKNECWVFDLLQFCCLFWLCTCQNMHHSSKYSSTYLNGVELLHVCVQRIHIHFLQVANQRVGITHC